MRIIVKFLYLYWLKWYVKTPQINLEKSKILPFVRYQVSSIVLKENSLNNMDYLHFNYSAGNFVLGIWITNVKNENHFLIFFPLIKPQTLKFVILSIYTNKKNYLSFYLKRNIYSAIFINKSLEWMPFKLFLYLQMWKKCKQKLSKLLKLYMNNSLDLTKGTFCKFLWSEFIQL